MAEPRPPLAAAAIFDLSGRVALVIDAAGTLGSRLAELLALNGAQVAFTGSGPESTARVNRILARGGRAYPVARDPEDRADIGAAFEEAEAALGPVDIVIHLIQSDGSHAYAVEERLGRLALLAEEARKRMRAGGTIVNVAWPPETPPDRESARLWLGHAGMERLSRLLALELGRSGIRLNNLAPDPASEAATDPSSASRPFEADLLRDGRREVEEFDGAILFLASDASRFLTGATLHVDGARIIQP